MHPSSAGLAIGHQVGGGRSLWRKSQARPSRSRSDLMTLVVDDYSATPVHPESMAFCRVAGSLSDVVGLTVQPADEPGLNIHVRQQRAGHHGKMPADIARGRQAGTMIFEAGED